MAADLTFRRHFCIFAEDAMGVLKGFVATLEITLRVVVSTT